ncbi:MAG: hypothetical protein ABFE07_02625 [Armatimonadia bacterium]
MRTAIVVTLLACLITGAAQAALWTKYVSPDKSFSFHHPAGWKLQAQDSVIEVANPNTNEQLLIIALPAKAGYARAVAEAAVKMLQGAMPDLKVNKWYGGDDEVAVFQTGYTAEGTPFLAHVEVLNQGGSAYWFSYSAPTTDYATSRAVALLQGVIGSVAAGADSKLPDIVAPPLAGAKLQRNAEAFVFVLEFVCGTVFGAAEEQAIVDDVLEGWRQLTVDEQSRYDGYHAFKLAIMSLGQQELATLRNDLQKELMPLLQQGEQSPSIKVIRQHLDDSQKTLVAGEPPLTEVAARSYAELVGYATLLQTKPAALPADTPAAEVASLKTRLVQVWPQFSAQEKEAVLGTPAVWMSTRQIALDGSGEEKARLRDDLKKLALAPEKPQAQAQTHTQSPTSGTAGGNLNRQLTANFINHQTLLMMQRQTFNTYMWSRGYSGGTPMGRF